MGRQPSNREKPLPQSQAEAALGAGRLPAPCALVIARIADEFRQQADIFGKPSGSIDVPEMSSAGADASAHEAHRMPGVRGSACISSLQPPQTSASPAQSLPSGAAAGDAVSLRGGRRDVGTRWTPERKAIIRRDWAAGRPSDEIIDDLNKLPGDPITSAQQLAYTASNMGVKRPCGFMTQRGAHGTSNARWIKLTPEQTALLIKGWMDGEPKKTIGKAIGVHGDTVQSHAERLGLPPRSPRNVPPVRTQADKAPDRASAAVLRDCTPERAAAGLEPLCVGHPIALAVLADAALIDMEAR